MRCLTCGKRIYQNMKECPNCGAMVPPDESKGRSERTMADWKSKLASRQAGTQTFGGQPAPPLPDQHSSASPDFESTFGSTLEEDATPEERPAPPPAPAWTRFIVPFMVILWIGIRMFGPNIQRFISGEPWNEEPVPSEATAAAPQLHQVLLCERVVNGQPFGPREKYSKAKDQQATVFTAWTGTAEASQFQVIWQPPQGKPISGTQTIIFAGNGTRQFFVLGELPLGEFTAAGRWSVQIMVNGNTVASSEFTVEP
jgi:hypothetical protein